MSDEAVKFQELIESLAEMPKDAPKAYVYLWQLETWLRQMVYVELKSDMGESWTDAVQFTTADRARESDLLLRHMPGPEKHVLSFMTLGDLIKVIERRWELFDAYLPPQSIWSARLMEVEQVRNRVAHFRYGNTADIERITALLRDIDRGMWHFCTSYNDTQPVLPPDSDPIAERVAYHEGGVPWASLEEGGWAMVTAPRKMSRLSVHLEISRRPWVEARQPPFVDAPGYVYSLVFTAVDGRVFDYMKLLEETAWCEPIVLHMLLESFVGSVRYTLPAVIGTQKLIAAIDRLVEAVLSHVLPAPSTPENWSFDKMEELANMRRDRIQKLANTWPEYVLGPNNPLTVLSPEMPCAFFLL